MHKVDTVPWSKGAGPSDPGGPGARQDHDQARRSTSATLGTVDVDLIETRLDALAGQRFHAKFHLRGRDAALVQLRGRETIRAHADELITKRVAPALPHKDGKQTPYRGHPVFVAQHATATCCRRCLERWHEIPRGRELSEDERAYVVDVIWRWIERELAPAAIPA